LPEPACSLAAKSTVPRTPVANRVVQQEARRAKVFRGLVKVPTQHTLPRGRVDVVCCPRHRLEQEQHPPCQVRVDVRIEPDVVDESVAGNRVSEDALSSRRSIQHRLNSSDRRLYLAVGAVDQHHEVVVASPGHFGTAPRAH